MFTYGPGDASKPLASLEGTLPFALDQAKAAFVCRALDLFLLFITSKDQVFSDFFKVQGRYALSALVGTVNKHLFSTVLDPATFVQLSVIVRDVLQTLQQRVRRGFSDHFDVDISALVGLAGKHSWIQENSEREFQQKLLLLIPLSTAKEAKKACLHRLFPILEWRQPPAPS